MRMHAIEVLERIHEIENPRPPEVDWRTQSK
jgi:hypothetical protein